MAEVISFINFKGGVGKTTLCVETAAALVKSQGAKVLLVDLDPQTNATFSLFDEEEWKNAASERKTLREFFQACCEDRTYDLGDIIMPYTRHDDAAALHVLPSHLELFGMDLKLVQQFGAMDVKAKIFLKNALDALKKQRGYDFVLIDCPPNLYLATQNALFASDHYVVVALAEYLSTLGLAHIQKEIKSLFGNCNKALASIGAHIPPPNFLGIIFNRLATTSGGTNAEARTMESIKAKYSDLVFKNFVSKSTQIAQRAEEKIPIALSGFAADKKYEEQMRKVAAEFYDRVTSPKNSSGKAV